MEYAMFLSHPWFSALLRQSLPPCSTVASPRVRVFLRLRHVQSRFRTTILSVTMICKIGHMQTSQLPTTLTAMDLFKLALVCNKYDCVGVVRAWAIIWVAALLEMPAAQDFEKLFLATHLLDLSGEFSRVSQSLIRDQSTTFSIVEAMAGQEFLPWTVYQCILLGQMAYRQEINKAFGSIVTGKERCSASHRSTCMFLHSLKKCGI